MLFGSLVSVETRMHRISCPRCLAATVVAYYIEPGMQFNRNNGRRCSVALD